MAIKGKGRTRGRRVIAAPPRPQLVVRKPPIWRRRWVWAVVGVLALGGILAGVLVSLNHRHARQFKAREIAIIQQYTNQLRDKLPTDRQVVPPDLVAFYTSLSNDFQTLVAGKMKPADAVARAKQVQSSAQAAATSISSLTTNLTKLIPADLTVTGLDNGASSVTGQSSTIEAPGATRQVLQDAQFLMSNAFVLWQQEGSLLEQAANATGADRKAFADQGVKLGQQAGTLFDEGYRKLVAMRNALGLQPPLAATQQTPTQPITPPASPTPSPTPSKSAKPSASPSR